MVLIAKVHQNQNILVFGMNKTGFTLIELLIALAIIGFLLKVAIPNYNRAQPGYERKEFIARLNALIRLGWQNALALQKIHKVLFDVKNGAIDLEVETDKFDDKGESVFKKVTGAYIKPSISLPDVFMIKNFFIEGFDEMARFAGRTEIWFFIVPEGLTQDVIINFLDTKDIAANGKPRPVSLVLSPFAAQFKEYDTFQKP